MMFLLMLVENDNSNLIIASILQLNDAIPQGEAEGHLTSPLGGATDCVIVHEKKLPAPVRNNMGGVSQL